ncbi:hypothetical protein [Devosia sp. Root635]|uniref:hypothetical protein n=1 Tax=Devosia sp. Root635 TaxID=1736575 RepID=UPI000701A051|nr:hypothetical protein [Devosia sp. Root635]KRA42057.1 hypothetical protein ASD80_10040 [Devosia sp. Root635]
MEKLTPAALDLVRGVLVERQAKAPQVVAYTQGTHSGVIHALAESLVFAKALNAEAMQRIASLEARIAGIEGRSLKPRIRVPARVIYK